MIAVLVTTKCVARTNNKSPDLVNIQSKSQFDCLCSGTENQRIHRFSMFIRSSQHFQVHQQSGCQRWRTKQNSPWWNGSIAPLKPLIPPQRGQGSKAVREREKEERRKAFKKASAETKNELTYHTIEERGHWVGCGATITSFAQVVSESAIACWVGFFKEINATGKEYHKFGKWLLRATMIWRVGFMARISVNNFRSPPIQGSVGFYSIKATYSRKKWQV